MARKAPRWLWLVLAGSLLANLVGASWLVYRRYIREVERPRHYQMTRQELFAALPVSGTSTVMLGDSHVDWAEWRELLGRDDVINRGISGDTVTGMIARIDEIVAGRPRTIAIMAGINDLFAGASVDEVAGRYRELVERIVRASPTTRIVVHSVLPVNHALAGAGPDWQTVLALNARLRAMCQDGACTYLSLHERLADPQGQLAREFTVDGVHLTRRGYVVWRDALVPLL